MFSKWEEANDLPGLWDGVLYEMAVKLRMPQLLDWLIKMSGASMSEPRQTWTFPGDSLAEYKRDHSADHWRFHRSFLIKNWRLANIQVRYTYFLD